MVRATVLLTAGTGYIGRRLIPELVTRGHRVRAIVRAGSENKVPTGAEAIVADVRSVRSAEPHVEAELRESSIPHTIVRPWYVLGPGHRWPHFMIPVYWLLGAIPATREGARRLGLVTIDQMVGACDQMRRRPALKTKQRPEPEGTRPLFRRRAGANVPTRTLGSHTREPLS